MERLTVKWKPKLYDVFDPIDVADNEYSKINFEKLLTKLGEYEDLEEQCIAENQCDLRMLLLKWKEFFDDIAELYDYRKAEEQGLLLRLPCKLGDTVYRIWSCGKHGKSVAEFEVVRIIIDWRGIWFSILNTNSKFCRECEISDFGKTVFATKEEAESALAEKGGA